MSKLKGRSLISITDYSKEEILQVLDIAEGFEKNIRQKLIDQYVVASLF
ncbi:MAG: aspartate carbamoyltransferase, partial [Bacteroidetes bacterium CG_4_10_14_3_um_filter_42_6]